MFDERKFRRNVKNAPLEMLEQLCELLRFKPLEIVKDELAERSSPPCRREEDSEKANPTFLVRIINNNQVLNLKAGEIVRAKMTVAGKYCIMVSENEWALINADHASVVQ